MLLTPWDAFGLLASEAGKIVINGWIGVCLAIFGAGLWLLRLALNFMEGLLTPDISASGPGAALYPVTFALAGALALVLAMVQVGTTAFRRDGKSLARLVIGLGQFAAVCAGYLSYAGVVMVASGGLTRALMESLLGVTEFRAWKPLEPINPTDVTDGVLATVLAFMGIFLIFAAVGHFLLMVVRAASVLVLVATGPIAAAGLVSDLGRSWFWKTLRWFHTLALSPVLVVLVMGVGIKFAEGVAVGYASTVEGSVGTTVGATLLVCIAVFSPAALFKLLSFVDPGTATGAAMRAGWTSLGGIQGVLQGHAGGSGAAATTGADGRSTGEDSAEAATTTRVATTTQGALGSALGGVGSALAAGLGVMATLGSTGAALTADLTNQMGVGHNSYYPDYTAGGGGNGARRANAEAHGQGGNPAAGTTDGPPPDDPATNPPPPYVDDPITHPLPSTTPSTPPTPPAPASPSLPRLSSSGAASAGESADAAVLIA